MENRTKNVFNITKNATRLQYETPMKEIPSDKSIGYFQMECCVVFIVLVIGARL